MVTPPYVGKPLRGLADVVIGHYGVVWGGRGVEGTAPYLVVRSAAQLLQVPEWRANCLRYDPLCRPLRGLADVVIGHYRGGGAARATGLVTTPYEEMPLRGLADVVIDHYEVV